MYPDNLRYTRTHEWISAEDDDTVTIGITEYATKELSDIVFIELPEPGKHVDKDSPLGAIESVKTVSDVYSPVDGEIVEVNREVVERPENIAKDSYGQGWLLRIKMANPQQLNEFLSSKEYETQLGEGGS